MKLCKEYPIALGILFVCILQSGMYAFQTINVNTVQEIQDAMANAKPGDEIVIASGTYTFSDSDKIPGAFGRNCYLHSDKNGTNSNRIILRGASSTNKPVIRGASYEDGYLLSLEGDYWIIKDIEFRTGSKGVILDDADYTDLINLEVHDVGEEAIHFRHGTTYSIADGCFVHDTGKNPAKSEFGEGFYIGSDRSVQDIPVNDESSGNQVFCPDWKRNQGRCGRFYNPAVNNITIKNCKIGPNVTAEHFDVREGSCQVFIENNVMDATGMINKDFQDSFIDLKGAYCFVVNNRFNRNNENAIEKGIQVLDRDESRLFISLTAKNNVIRDNIFNLDSPNIPALTYFQKTDASVSSNYAYDNERNPSGTLYQSGSDFTEGEEPNWGNVDCLSEGITLSNNNFVVNDRMFFIIPNPTRSFIAIEGLEDIKSATIYGLQGQKILRLEGQRLKNNTFDVSDLATGTYVLRVDSVVGSGTQLFTKR